MKRVVIVRPGGYNQVVIEESAELKPEAGHVVIDVEAAGVNYADCIVRMGLYQSARKLMGYPMTPGFEFAGRVSSVGEGVSNFVVGQAVFGITFFNGYATQVSVPENQLFVLPSGISMSEAAAFPVAFITAWYAAVKLGQASPKMTALVHAAAGGVGSALIQVLRVLDCDVIGVVGSSEKVATAMKTGCHKVIDKSTEPLWKKAEEYSKKGYDLIFDSIGMTTLGEGYRHLAPMGRLISFGFSSMLPKTGKVNYISLARDFFKSARFNPIRMADHNRSVMAFNLSFLFEHKEILAEGMTQIMQWLQEGKIKPLPVTEYRFENVIQAHRDIESGKTVGRLVLRMRPL